jgi:hypothetical protein
MRIMLGAVQSIFVLTALSAPSAAQERCKWFSDDNAGDVTTYPQQLNIDVGDTPGHIVGVYEIHNVAGPNTKPNCEGLKDKETWTHGYRDYRDRNGRTWGYSVTTLESGDKIYAEFSGVTQTVAAPDGSRKTTSDVVSNWTGGTGRYEAVRGLGHEHNIVEWAKGESKPTSLSGSGNGEYWFDK